MMYSADFALLLSRLRLPAQEGDRADLMTVLQVSSKLRRGRGASRRLMLAFL